MEIELTTEAQKDLEFWKLSNSESVLRKIRILLESIQISPFRGIGKPESLKHELAGKWSRRITKEHRFVYSIENKTIYNFFPKRSLLRFKIRLTLDSGFKELEITNYFSVIISVELCLRKPKILR